ncbi:hypothetical protein PV11_03800 [Exophiala sideris]|uniref:Cytochrome P450 oxidoreductase n=1 Tax=Exophiala sideris TaxID=1016849 RepID=A0A0D1VYY7_9EURO|nr:hypothetical protein PV11_03800 [Exophiala sideris]
MAPSVRQVLWSLVTVFVVGTVVTKIRMFFRHPAAPGPKLALVTRLWYALQVWGAISRTGTSKPIADMIVRVAPSLYSIDDPEAIKVIYGVKSPMAKSSWYSAFGVPGIPNQNLFCTRDQSKHTIMRRKVAHLYSMTSIKAYKSHVDDCIQLILDKFDRFAETGHTFSLDHWLQCYAFDVIGKITFGKTIGFLESGGKDISGIMKSLDSLTSFCSVVGVNIALLPLCLLVFGDPSKGPMAFTKEITGKREDDNLGDGSSISTDASYGDVKTFVQKLEKLRAEMSPQEFEDCRIEYNALTNVVAGSDTTGLTLTAVLLNICTHPTVHEKFRQEIKIYHERRNNEIVVQDKRVEARPTITFDQAQSMPYFQLVLKETMRLHPATGLPLWRDLPQGGAMIAGTFFPGGTSIGINSWVIHRNTSVFGNDASLFRPERWDPSLISNEDLARMDGCYIPFGAGARTCIGKNVSLLEINKLIPELVARYEFDLISPPDLVWQGQKPEPKKTNNFFVKRKDIMVKIRRAQVA